MNAKKVLFLKGSAVGSLGALVSVLSSQFGITSAFAAPLSESVAHSHSKAHVTKAHVTKAHVTKAHVTKAHVTKAHVTKAHVTKAHAVKKKVVKRKAAAASSSGSFLGAMTQTQFGPFEVEVTLSNGRITQVSTPVYPNSLYRDQQINSQAIPMLEQEVLKVQSSNIQGVGGASYTSQGFYGSLVSALAKAHHK